MPDEASRPPQPGAAPAAGPAVPGRRAELWMLAAFWLVAGAAATACGIPFHWLQYAAPLALLPLLWPLVRARRWAEAALDWAPLPLVIVTYDMLHAVSGRCRAGTIDAWLREADRALLGNDAATLLHPIAAPALTVFLAACYASYYLAPFSLAVWWYARGRRTAFRELMVGQVGALVIGYLGYLFLPAKGPHASVPATELPPPLAGDFVGPLIHDRVVDHGGIYPRDAFPSLHTANAVTLLLMAWRRERRLLWVYAVPMGGLMFATVYLRYHWVADVLAGAALAVAWQGAAVALVRREAAAAPSAPADGA